MAIQWFAVTVDRTDSTGRVFQPTIHIGPDGYSQSGEDLGETQPLAAALFDAAAQSFFEED